MAKICDIPCYSPVDRKRSAPVLPPKAGPHNPTLLCVKGSTQRPCKVNLWRKIEYSLQWSSRFIGTKKVDPAWFILCVCVCVPAAVSQWDTTLRVVFTLLTGTKAHLQHAVQDVRWSSYSSTEGDVSKNTSRQSPDTQVFRDQAETWTHHPLWALLPAVVLQITGRRPQTMLLLRMQPAAARWSAL